MLDQLEKFINYWWFRYLMVTELYIVEKWERVVMRKCILNESWQLLLAFVYHYSFLKNKLHKIAFSFFIKNH